MIDHQRKLLFVHIARTGGTSIEAALVGCDWWEIDPATKHLSASQAKRLYGDEIWSSYTTFTVVRNPWDRLVSMYVTGWWRNQEPEPGPEGLRKFLDALQPHPNEKYQSLHYCEILEEPVDHVLRFERLAADFSDLMTQVGEPTLLLPHHERRDRDHYRRYYDETTRRMVAERFAADIARFEYTF